MKLQTLFPIVSLTLTSIPMALAAEPTPISVDDYLAKFPSTSSEEPGEHHNLCGYQQGDAAGPGLNEDNYHKIFDAGPELCLYQVKNGTERDPQTIKALWVVRGCTCRFYRDIQPSFYCNESNRVMDVIGPAAIEQWDPNDGNNTATLPASMYVCSNTTQSAPVK